MKNLILSLLTSVLLINCASVISLTETPINITSNPSNATVEVLNSSNETYLTCITPFYAHFKKDKKYFEGEEYTFYFTKDGYEPLTLTLKTQLNPWYFGNVFMGGPIGLLVIDPLTGNMWSFDKNNIHGELKKK